MDPDGERIVGPTTFETKMDAGWMGANTIAIAGDGAPTTTTGPTCTALPSIPALNNIM